MVLVNYSIRVRVQGYATLMLYVFGDDAITHLYYSDDAKTFEYYDDERCSLFL